MKKISRFFKRVKKWLLKAKVKELMMIGLIIFLLLAGGLVIWISSLQLPDLSNFDQQIMSQSTKIYDRTGTVLLYDFGNSTRRTYEPLDKISPYIQDATISIEDEGFYSHGGIKVSSTIRAALADIFSLKFSQGGSTITQQVIKNALLTQDKTITRKIKEIVLSIKLEQELSKDKILELYLNETPYGGTIYGVQEAAEQFFGKNASDVDIAESAYIAALPQAPTYYSPYGSHLSDLETRKNLVLQKMKQYGYITETQYEQAVNEKVAFQDSLSGGIKAPHFVMYIRDYIEQKYGDTILQTGGLKVITTLDYDMQQKAEAVVKQYVATDAVKYHATNAGLVAIDSPTGQILAMVGSADYFDTANDGNFNVTTALRQPGSSFKPFVYSVAFNDGYTPNTVLFDVKTQFSTTCPFYSTSNDNSKNCYSPNDYDNKFRGPITIRNALAQSINIPAVKTLYLVGVPNAIKMAQDMGITTLTDPKEYGLSLVLGGGAVKLLDMTSAYSVFADEGVRHPDTGILSITDSVGNVLEQYQNNPIQVLPKQTALLITDVLSDNVARTPEFGAASSLYFPGRDVAVKTGTTNDFRDMWIIGYTPSITVGAWMGNNDNSPIAKQVAGYIAGPMWHAFMNEILPGLPNESFDKPDPVDVSNQKPLLNGTYVGPDGSIHSELYWIDKSNPLGPPPSNPNNDPQFSRWEYGVQYWLQSVGRINFSSPTVTSSQLGVAFITPTNGATIPANTQTVVSINSTSAPKKADYFLNGNYIGSSTSYPFSFSFIPTGVGATPGTNTLKVVITDQNNNTGTASVNFQVQGLSD